MYSDHYLHSIYIVDGIIGILDVIKSYLEGYA